MKKRHGFFLGILVSLTAALASCVTSGLTAVPTAVPTPYKGVALNVIGPQTITALEQRASDFQRLTGATVTVAALPPSDLSEKALSDLSTGMNKNDVIILDTQSLGGLAAAGYLMDLTDRVAADKPLDWEGVSPFFRDVSARFQGHVYSIPLDGDFLRVYYRKDVFDRNQQNPPESWGDYVVLAQNYFMRDLNYDGTPDEYGSCLAMKPGGLSYLLFTSIAASFFQSQGTAQGAFFTTDSMQPLLGSNEAMAKALNIYASLLKLGPKNQLSLSLDDTRSLFLAGKCALTIDWGDLGPLSADKSKSKFPNSVGAIELPGSTEVLDRTTGKLVQCNGTTCPYATDGTNHAPFAASSDWACAINAQSHVQDAAYAFCSYLSQPAQSNTDVFLAASGLHPYRTDQVISLDPWLHLGMSQAVATTYRDTIKSGLSNRNMVLDLRIAESQTYGQVLDAALAQFLGGQTDADATMKQIQDGWNKLTDQLGRDKQLAAYKASFGVTK